MNSPRLAHLSGRAPEQVLDIQQRPGCVCRVVVRPMRRTICCRRCCCASRGARLKLRQLVLCQHLLHVELVRHLFHMCDGFLCGCLRLLGLRLRPAGRRRKIARCKGALSELQMDLEHTRPACLRAAGRGQPASAHGMCVCICSAGIGSAVIM